VEWREGERVLGLEERRGGDYIEFARSVVVASSHFSLSVLSHRAFSVSLLLLPLTTLSERTR